MWIVAFKGPLVALIDCNIILLDTLSGAFITNLVSSGGVVALMHPYKALALLPII